MPAASVLKTDLKAQRNGNLAHGLTATQEEAWVFDGAPDVGSAQPRAQIKQDQRRVL